MRKKIIIVGLDGAEPELLQKWSAEGVLPHLRKLMGQCAWLEPQTTAPFGDGVFWPAFFTGVGPAKHGRYFRFPVARGGYTWERYNEDEDFTSEPVWQLASDAGRKVAVIDVPYAPLTRGLNGVQLVDWIVHDRCGRTRSHPASLAREITERFGMDPNDGNCEGKSGERRTQAALETLGRQLAWRVDAKRRASLELLQKAACDLFMVCFQEAHDAGHQCWHLHDIGHPLHHGEGTDTTHDPMKDVYIALDRAAGDLARQASDNDILFVLAGLGMGPAYTGNHLLDDILKRIERGGAARSYLGGWRGIYRSLPAAFRDRLKGVAARANAKQRRCRKFYTVPNNENAGAIRINVVGREPDGLVQSGREYNELCEELSTKLKNLINADTGNPAVDEVVKVSERFDGPQLERLPDLLVVWKRFEPIRAIRGAEIGETARREPPGSRTGDHTQRALALVRGPGIEPCRIDRPISIMDLGATVAALLGVSIPDTDGEPIAHLVTRS